MHRRTFLRGTGGAVAGLTFAGTASAQNGGTIRIGSDIPYRPFEYRTTTGELVGFDVDIANAIFGGQLDRNYEFVQTSFDTIIPSLNNGNFRVIMSAMTITPERAKQVDFSNPYFTAYQTVLVLKDGGITKLQDLKGQTVAVQKGTTGESPQAVTKAVQRRPHNRQLRRHSRTLSRLSGTIRPPPSSTTIRSTWHLYSRTTRPHSKGKGGGSETGRETHPRTSRSPSRTTASPSERTTTNSESRSTARSRPSARTERTTNCTTNTSRRQGERPAAKRRRSPSWRRPTPNAVSNVQRTARRVG